MKLLALGRVVPRSAAAPRRRLGRAPLIESTGRGVERRHVIRFSFHPTLLATTEAYWLDDPPDATCKDGTRQHAVDDPLLSCKQQVAGSSRGASSKGTGRWWEAPGRSDRVAWGRGKGHPKISVT
jgi:hypothetical protein